ncbi:MAG: DUF2155 domain-containing protein [Alphaproteobacteria bacterium]|nr:DUF2155 domain-containing protein [Alphaproteobacteria bacterium]
MVMEDMNTVVLRTIDKLSARTHTFDIPVNKTVKFGNALFIKVRACRKSSPLDKPESAAFLQIWEHPSGEAQAKWMFSGWMFASSPSLSALDHPVYDVWVIDCKNAKTSVKEDAAFSSEQAPGKVPPEGAKPAPKSDAKSDEVKSDTPAPSAAKPSPAPSGARPGLTPRDLEQLPGSFDDDSGTDDAAPSTDDPQD